MQNNTKCIRCGKIRIVASSWKEYIGTSLVTYTNTVCPDPECQKIVDEQLKKKKDKLLMIQTESLERRKAMRINRKLKKTKALIKIKKNRKS
ncbi:hypothetical protein FJY90_08035 [Candidatus Gottesmanbacteria bacterium]|nr:hypothetical protein [Candidatus Gottesmanbacteria bacterium]